MSDDQVTTEPGARTRRALLVGAGALGASVVLAACGDEDGTGAAPLQDGGGSPAAGGNGETGGAAALGKASDVPVGGGTIFAKEGVVVTQPSAGDFKGFNNICTHQGCPVASVDGGTINCTCHGSRYSIEDGSVKNGPATRGLAAKQIQVDGDDIVLA